MFATRFSLRTSIRFGALAVGALLLGGSVLQAGGPPPGIPSGVMPWEYQKYRNHQPLKTNATLPPPPAPFPAYHRSAHATTLQITILPKKQEAEERGVAYVVAQLPKDAQLFFDDTPTTSRGTMRTYETPRLAPGHDYHYTVRVVWNEHSKRVSQVSTVSVHAGGVTCLDIIHTDSQALQKDIEASLAKLSPEDRELAEAQRICPVQEGIRLGAMETPVKVTVKGQPVFLCCHSCAPVVHKDESATLKKVEQLKANKADVQPAKP
jgi:uncharacterized protein (TIGR03000 family)